MEFQPISPKSLVDEVAATCRDVFARNRRRGLEFDVQIEGELLPVSGDVSQLRQGISNLCTNARDALEALPEDDTRTARIVLKAEIQEITTPPQSAHGHVGTGRFISISVSDNGIGMDDAMQEHLFEPFIRAET